LAHQNTIGMNANDATNYYMKLLFENWRKYLNERVTDDTYTKIIDFLVDAYSDSANYELSEEEEGDEAEELLGFLGGFGFEPGELEAIAKDVGLEKLPAKKITSYEYVIPEKRVEEVYDRLLEKVPEADKMLGLENILYLNLKFYYNDSDGDPSADTNFEMKGRNVGGYFTMEDDDGLPALVVNFGSSFFKPPMPHEEFAELDQAKTFKILKNNSGILRDIIYHEFTHMLDSARIGFARVPAAKGLKRHHRRKSLEMQKALSYANSTEEIQARMIPIYKMVQSALDGAGVGSSPTEEIVKLIVLEVKNKSPESLKNIVKYLFGIYELQHENFLDHTSQRNKRRISKRFYEFAQEWLGAE